jgi:glycosyltransferase involved in cell wall biosynthesis
LVNEQIKCGKNVRIIYLKGRGELSNDFEQAGAQVISNLANKNFLYKMWKLFFLVQPEIDVVHAHLPESELLACLTPISHPIVVSRHNSEHFFPNHRILSRVLSKLVESRAKRCIAISKTVQNFILDSGEWVNEDTISVVHYGIDCAKLVEHPKNISKNEVKYLTISRLVPQKSIPTLLRAFAKHAKKYPEDKLSIVGDGVEANQYKVLAESLDIQRNIIWIGRVRNVETFYRSNDVFVLPSKYEGFGLVLLEAMCERIAILGSNISSIPEVLGSNHPGLFESEAFFDLARLMEKSRDYRFRRSLISYQNTKLTEFSSTVMEKNIDYVYKRLF